MVRQPSGRDRCGEWSTGRQAVVATRAPTWCGPRLGGSDSDLAAGAALAHRRRARAGLRPALRQLVRGRRLPAGARGRPAVRPDGRWGGGRAVALGRRRAPCRLRHLPAPGRSAARQPGGVRHAGLPLARARPGRFGVRRLAAVPGARRRCPRLGKAGRGGRRGAHRAARRAHAARDRPGVDSVFTATGRCEPQDVVANRLDPWHGSWFHPYSFVDLSVVREPQGARTTLSSSTSPSGWPGGSWSRCGPSSPRRSHARSSCASPTARAPRPWSRRTRRR